LTYRNEEVTICTRGSVTAAHKAQIGPFDRKLLRRTWLYRWNPELVEG